MVRLIIDNQQVRGKAYGEINDTLNEINKMEFVVPASTKLEQDIFEIDSIVEVFTLQKYYEFVIVSEGQDDINSFKYTCVGIEEVLFGEFIDIDSLNNATNKTLRTANYLQISFSNFANDLLPNGWTLQTSIFSNIDFRVNSSMTKWNAISRCCNENGYEFDIDYENKTLIVEVNIGRQGFDSINEKLDFEGMPVKTTERPKGKKVIVEGKGDGDFKVIATATDPSFNPSIHKAYRTSEPNIFTVEEAQKRADIELERLKEKIVHFTIPRLTERKVGKYKIGDTIFLNVPSMNIGEKELKIVKKIIDFEGNEEDERLEVTSANYARAIKSYGQKVNEQVQRIQDQISSMQGSGNFETPQGQINATNNAPLRIPIFVDNYTNQAGELTIRDFTLDVDIDPFRRGAGTATATDDLFVSGLSGQEDPSLQAGTLSDDDDPRLQAGTVSENEDIQAQTGTNYKGSNNQTSIELTGNYQLIVQTTIDDNCRFFFYQVEMTFTSVGAPPCTLDFYVSIGNTTPRSFFHISDPFSNLGYVLTGVIATVFNTTGQTMRLYGRINVGNGTIQSGASIGYNGLLTNHNHGRGIYRAEDHEHGRGTYRAENHRHTAQLYDIPISELSKITIGDNVTDATQINATGFNWELREIVNGTSTIRNSGTQTFGGGNTFIKNIDISDSGTYPNSLNLWELWVFPNSSNADLVKARINVKHNLDN